MGQPWKVPGYIASHTVVALASHEALVTALEALEKLTTACATNPHVMREIDLFAYDAAVEAEGRARDELDAARAIEKEGDDPCHGPQDTTCDACGMGSR